MKTLVGSRPFGLPNVPQAGWIAASGQVLTLQGRQIQLWTREGVRLAEHPVDASTGRFGEGADGTIWLATGTSVYLLELSAGGFASVACHSGGLPVGCDEHALAVQQAGFVARFRRVDGEEISRTKIPLRKKTKARFEQLSPDGQHGLFVDVDRAKLFQVDLEAGTKPTRVDVDSKAITSSGHSYVQPNGERVAFISGDALAILRCADGKLLKHFKGHFRIGASSAAGIVTGAQGTLSLYSWDGEVLTKIKGRSVEEIWGVLALAPDGSHMLCDGPSGVCLRETKTGALWNDGDEASSDNASSGEASANEAPYDPTKDEIQLPRNLGTIEDIRRAGKNLVLHLDKYRVQLRSPDGSELLLSARAEPPHEGVFATESALFRWTMGGLEVLQANTTKTLTQPEILTNASGSGEQLLVVSKHHDGVSSALYDTTTCEATPIKMAPKDSRGHVFLAPGARYALGWEDLRDLRIYPGCRSRAKVKYRHEDFGIQLLRFSASGERFAYVTSWWRLYVWDAKGTEPEARFDTVDDLQIRAVAYGGETLWVAAGENLYRMVEGAPVLHASPGPVTRIFVDGERLLCVLRGGLIAVDA